jgi:hypothetical protein
MLAAVRSVLKNVCTHDPVPIVSHGQPRGSADRLFIRTTVTYKSIPFLVTLRLALLAVNGTSCNDADNATINDRCVGVTCVGTPATCGNQNFTCPLPNQRLNFTRLCIPGVTCNATTCCRACASQQLVVNGATSGSGLTGWTVTPGGTWSRIFSGAFIQAVDSTTASMSQTVCNDAGVCGLATHDHHA